MSKKFKYITGKIIINSFGNETDQTGETEGYCDFEFKLVEPIRVAYGGRSYMYDRVSFVMQSWMGPFSFKGPKKAYADMPMPTAIAREIYECLRAAESGNGKLKDWCFSDEIEGLAYPERAKRWPS